MTDSKKEDERYKDLLIRHRQQVWRLCQRYAGYDMELCADMVQEVAVVLWERFGRLRPEASSFEESAWVYWNARDVLGKIYRRQRRQSDTVPLADWMAESIADDRDGVRERVEEMIDGLPDDERELIHLWLDGYRAGEIGKKTGLARNNVYRRIYMIIQKLKQMNHAE